MTLGQRMIVMNGGVAEQIGTPDEVYSRPATSFVASFIGSPPMNLLQGKISADGHWMTIGEDKFELPFHPLHLQRQTEADTETILGVRPEHLFIGMPGLPLRSIWLNL